MRNYKQLSQGQRYQIEILLKAGHTQKEIAQQLNVSSATISREIKRNKGKRGYRPKQTQIKADKRGQIRNRVSIDERPALVEEKTRIGDWEIDTVIGQNHQGALVTIVDRVSKFTLIKKVDSKHAEVVTEATIILLQPYIDKTLTITADNGKEFAGHEKIKEQLNAEVYFAHPYHSPPASD